MFPTSSRKIPKEGIFCNKFRHFSYSHVLQLNKIEDADFKYDNIVFKFQPKNTQIKHAGSQIQPFLFFCSFFPKILQLDKFDGVDFEYHNSIFKFLPQNTQIRYFWTLTWALFHVFHESLHLDKFEGADFKYDSFVFKFQFKNTQIRLFWSQVSPCCFFVKFCFQTKSRKLISNMAIFLARPQKKSNNAFFVSNLSFFIFSKSFPIRQNWTRLTSNKTIFFSNLCPKTPK